MGNQRYLRSGFLQAIKRLTSEIHSFSLMKLALSVGYHWWIVVMDWGSPLALLICGRRCFFSGFIFQWVLSEENFEPVEMFFFGNKVSNFVLECFWHIEKNLHFRNIFEERESDGGGEKWRKQDRGGIGRTNGKMVCHREIRFFYTDKLV